MSLKVIDGLRTLDGANHKIDIPAQSVASGATVNGTSHDMSDHNELLAAFLGGAVTGAGSLACVVQESNEAAANFTNVAGATVTITTANFGQLMSVDWRSPLRKRYARLSVTASVNTVAVSAAGLRVGNRSSQDLDGAALQA